MFSNKNLLVLSSTAAIVIASIVYRASTRPVATSASRCSDSYPKYTSREKTIASLLHPGRVISWAEYGPESGKPLLFFHGTPGSRVVVIPSHLKTLCDKHNVRLIAYERPSIGKTSPPSKEEPSILFTTSQDVAEIVTHLGIQSPLHVSAYSMGGPSGIAFTAYANTKHLHSSLLSLPSVSHLDLMAPAAFVSHPRAFEGLVGPNKLAHYLTGYAPRLYLWFMSSLQGILTHEDDYIDSMLALIPPLEKQSLIRANSWEETVETWRITSRETWRQGVLGFLSNCVEVFGKPAPDGWKIFGASHPEESTDLGNMTSFKGVQVRLYHGRRDNVAPFVTGEELVGLLESSGATVQVKEQGSEDSHFLIVQSGLIDIISNHQS